MNSDLLQYLLKRLIMMIPTLFGITLIVFLVINLAPGSPIEQRLQAIRFSSSQGGGESSGAGTTSDHGVSKEVIEALKKQYGFDKPIHIRYWIWLKNLSRLDFGESFTYERPVLEVVMSKLPVSLQFGITSFILSYLICIPLGIFMALKEGQSFDTITSSILFILYSIPPLMLGILLVVFFAGGSFLDLFPTGEMYSDDYFDKDFFGKFQDRLSHAVLPLITYMIGSFTTLTLLMKNSILDEIKKDYIRTARAKGLDEKVVYLKHALRNALIPIVTGLSGLLTIFFAGSIIVERIFQLDGMGLLSFNSILSRDYNVLMGLIFVQALLLLVGKILSDIIYLFIDPRIDFQ